MPIATGQSCGGHRAMAAALLLANGFSAIQAKED